MVSYSQESRVNANKYSSVDLPQFWLCSCALSDALCALRFGWDMELAASLSLFRILSDQKVYDKTGIWNLSLYEQLLVNVIRVIPILCLVFQLTQGTSTSPLAPLRRKSAVQRLSLARSVDWLPLRNSTINGVNQKCRVNILRAAVVWVVESGLVDRQSAPSGSLSRSVCFTPSLCLRCSDAYHNQG